MDVNASVDSQAEINRLQAENVNLRLKVSACIYTLYMCV